MAMMPKSVRIGCAALLFLPLALLLAGFLFLLSAGGTIKTAVNAFGPGLLGVPVTLRDADVRPLSGTAHLRGLHVGNPPGFSTPALLDVDEVAVELDILSLFSDTIHVRRALVEKPRFTYERGEDKSNVSVVQDTLGAGKKKEKPPAEETAGSPAGRKPGAKKAEKKVIIDELIVKDPQLNASLTALNGRYVAVKLGDIEVRDIGRAEGGVTFSEAVRQIFASVAANIEKAVGEVAGSLKEAANEVKKAAAPLIDAFKDAFGIKKEKKKKKEPGSAAPTP